MNAVVVASYSKMLQNVENAVQSLFCATSWRFMYGPVNLTPCGFLKMKKPFVLKESPLIDQTLKTLVCLDAQMFDMCSLGSLMKKGNWESAHVPLNSD